MSWKTDIEKALSMTNIRKAMETAARDILPVVSDRIFTKGLSSDGESIGEYSTKPIYISKKNSPLSAGEVKDKTYFFPGGYRQFKSEIGRGSEVNLKVFGRLQQDYLTPKRVDTSKGVKYELKEEKNIQKKAGAEDRFKVRIFDLNQSEREMVVDTFDFEIRRRIG